MVNRLLAVALCVALMTAARAEEPAPLPHSAGERLQITVRHLFAKPFHRPRPLRLDAGDVAIDTHVHTEFSPDSRASIRDVILQAVQRGLSAIAITDHNTMDGLPKAGTVLAEMRGEGSVPPGFFIIPGEEVSSGEGHIIALYINSPIPARLTAAETIRRIHAQGGLAIAAHPMDHDSLADLALSLPFDGVETMNGAEETAYLSAKDAACQRRRAFYAKVTQPRYGASDAHDPRMVGSCYTVLPGCEPTAAGVREALYAGDTQPSTAPAMISRTRGIARGGRWLTWTAQAFPAAEHTRFTPMLRVPLRRGSLTLKLDGATGMLFRRLF